MAPVGSSFVCESCGKDYQDDKSLARHQRFKPTTCGLVRVTEETGTHFTCGLCGTDFRYARQLEEHIHGVHLSLEQSQGHPQGGEAMVCCRLCGHGFSSAARLRGHMKRAHSPFILMERLNIEFH